MNEIAKLNVVNQIRLVDEVTGEIKRLKGFKKGYRVPDKVSDRDQAYVAEAAFEEMNKDLEETFAGLRSAFKFKRKETSVTGPEAGFGAITTPVFSYEISIEQIEDRPSHYCIRRAIADIRDPEHSLGNEFESVFADRFRALEITAESEFDVEAIIDRVEDAESDTITIDYDKHATWCEIQLGPATVHIAENRIRIIDEKSGKNLRGLFEAFQAVHKQFIAMLEFGDDWFATPSN